MARKTVVMTTNAEQSAAEFAADARTDRQTVKAPTPSGLMSLSELRERRGRITERELLKRCRDAARAELRGEMFSPDDRADVAAQVMADVLAEFDGLTPSAESRRVRLDHLRDRAKTLRRSLERQRDRDAAQAERDAQTYALSADALGVSPTPAKHAAIVGRAGARAAERAALAVLDMLGLPAETDSPVFSLFYVWARGENPEVCAAERDVTHAAWRVRQTRGAKFVRGFYGAGELLARLSLGADVAADGTLTYVMDDESREARDRTRMLAPDWRDRADAYPCQVRTRRLTIAQGRVPARQRRAAQAQRQSDLGAALGRLGRAIGAADGRRRERTAPDVSALARGLREDAA